MSTMTAAVSLATLYCCCNYNMRMPLLSITRASHLSEWAVGSLTKIIPTSVQSRMFSRWRACSTCFLYLGGLR